MTVRVLYFARIREVLGLDAEEIEMVQGATVGDVLDGLAERYGIVQSMRTAIRAGVNDRYASREDVLSDGDEIALLSPVSGG